MIVRQIKRLLTEISKNQGYFKLSEEVVVEHPVDEGHGDYATNLALVLAKTLKANPRELADKVAIELIANQPDFIKKIEIAGPGFINFHLSEHYLLTELQSILSLGDKYGSGEILKKKKIAVEYTDPNPFKEFHIGHLYSNLIGESIAKIFEANGAKVWRGDFYGDVGMHVAKAVWGMMRKMEKEKVTITALNKNSIRERQRFLGQGYAWGVLNYEKDEQVKEEIKDLNYLIYIANQEYRKREKGWEPIIDYAQFVEADQKRLKEVQEVYEAGLQWSLEYFETIYKRLGTKFDGYYPESWAGELGMRVVEKGLRLGVLKKSQGALIYEGEQDGLHTRVFVNKLGLPTYEAKDLGLAQAKYDDFKYDKSLNVFGKEIDEYYKVVKAVMLKIEPELGKKAEHLAHGMVKLPEGKMSSRTGNVITCEWLLDETTKRVQKIMENSEIENPDETAEMVAQGAVKYAFLKSKIGSDIIFNFSSSVDFEGNSGPYLQYTYARAKSVLRKAGEIPQLSETLTLKNAKLIFKDTELSILRYLYRFSEVVEKAAQEYAPSLICTYLHELAQRFNAFYNQETILGLTKQGAKSDKRRKELTSEQGKLRLALTAGTAQVLKNGLRLLGIKAPEKM